LEIFLEVGFFNVEKINNFFNKVERKTKNTKKQKLFLSNQDQVKK